MRTKSLILKITDLIAVNILTLCSRLTILSKLSKILKYIGNIVVLLSHCLTTAISIYFLFLDIVRKKGF